MPTSLIPLVPKDLSKITKGSYVDVRINDMGDVVKVHRFTGMENIEVLFNVCDTVEILKDVKRVTTPASMFQSLLSLTIGPARATLQMEWKNRDSELSLFNADNEKKFADNPSKGPPAMSFQEEDYYKVRERWVRNYVKRSAFEKQEMWMLSIMEKPTFMPIREFYSRVEQLISYGKYYPRPIIISETGRKTYGEPPLPLTDKQKRVILLRAVPSEWKQSIRNSGRPLEGISSLSLVELFEEVEDAHATSGKPRGNGQSAEGSKPHQRSKQWKRGRKDRHHQSRDRDTRKKWCSFCKMTNHDTANCFKKPKQSGAENVARGNGKKKRSRPAENSEHLNALVSKKVSEALKASREKSDSEDELNNLNELDMYSSSSRKKQKTVVYVPQTLGTISSPQNVNPTPLRVLIDGGCTSTIVHERFTKHLPKIIDPKSWKTENGTFTTTHKA
ncbi:MAG: hypothetical protein ACREOZ_01795, partial [Gloeomargaritales cyanobacterium]